MCAMLSAKCPTGNIPPRRRPPPAQCAHSPPHPPLLLARRPAPHDHHLGRPDTLHAIHLPAERQPAGDDHEHRILSREGAPPPPCCLPCFQLSEGAVFTTTLPSPATLPRRYQLPGVRRRVRMPSHCLGIHAPPAANTGGGGGGTGPRGLPTNARTCTHPCPAAQALFGVIKSLASKGELAHE